MDNLSGNTNKPVVKPAVKEAVVETKAEKDLRAAIYSGVGKIEEQLTELLNKEFAKAQLNNDSKLFAEVKNLIGSMANDTKEVVDEVKKVGLKKAKKASKYKL